MRTRPLPRKARFEGGGGTNPMTRIRFRRLFATDSVIVEVLWRSSTKDDPRESSARHKAARAKLSGASMKRCVKN